MSQENLEIVRQSWDAWMRRDLDGALVAYAEDTVWDMTHFRDWPESTYVGSEGMRRFLNEWLEIWDEFEAGVEKFIVAPDGRIVSLAWQRGKGRHSGLAMDMNWAMIITVRDGRFVRVENYDDRDEALEAVGLSE